MVQPGRIVGLLAAALCLGSCDGRAPSPSPERSPQAPPPSAPQSPPPAASNHPRPTATTTSVRDPSAEPTSPATLPAAGVPGQGETSATPPPEPAARPGDRPPRPKGPPPRSLGALAQQAQAHAFDLPAVDPQRVAQAGLWAINGRHLTVYTDLPAAPELEELPAVFDAAVPLWCAYFGLDANQLSDWRMLGCVMQRREPFIAAGLYPADLPDFPNGYSVGSVLWVYRQPSAYYLRHLLLHEGTHAFMLRWLGGAGPPWYMEGMAEYLATHRWQDGQLTLAVLPHRKEDVPYWGRVKIVKDEAAAGRALSLLDIFQYDAHAHLRVEPYGWCWAAAMFLDHHPLSQQPFRNLQNEVLDRSLEFSKRFCQHLAPVWPAITEDWQVFVAECDYGYDVPRAAIQRRPARELPPEGAVFRLATDRGWQSTGWRLRRGQTYELSVEGRYQLVAGPPPWPCEAGGVTIRYWRGHPLGMLLAGWSEVEGNPPAVTPLVEPLPIGRHGRLTPPDTATLFLKINEPAGDLADNDGTLTVTIRPSNDLK